MIPPDSSAESEFLDPMIETTQRMADPSPIKTGHMLPTLYLPADCVLEHILAEPARRRPPHLRRRLDTLSARTAGPPPEPPRETYSVDKHARKHGPDKHTLDRAGVDAHLSLVVGVSVRGSVRRDASMCRVPVRRVQRRRLRSFWYHRWVSGSRPA